MTAPKPASTEFVSLPGSDRAPASAPREVGRVDYVRMGLSEAISTILAIKCRGIREASVILVSLIGVCGCTTAIGPPGKSAAQLAAESNSCNYQASQYFNRGNFELIYAQCMEGYGNTVRLSDGQVLTPPQYVVPTTQYTQPAPQAPTPPPYVPAPPIYATPSPAPTLPDPGQPSDAVSRFRKVVAAHRSAVLMAAHPTAHLDNADLPQVKSNYGHNAIVVDEIVWHGVSGKSFDSFIHYSIQYDDNQLISSLKIEMEEPGNPFPPAFFAADLAKQAILRYCSDKMQGKAAKLLVNMVNMVNSNTSVKSALEEFLVVATNGGGTQ